jgi:hypothetical protein
MSVGFRENALNLSAERRVDSVPAKRESRAWTASMPRRIGDPKDLALAGWILFGLWVDIILT